MNAEQKEASKGYVGGRKPLPAGEKKVQVTLYVPEKIVNELGGYEASKVSAEKHLQRQYETRILKKSKK